MSTLLQQYEQQYGALIAETTAYIGRLQLSSRSERRDVCAKIDENIQEANELLEQMNLEVRDIDAASRGVALSKLECSQVELQRLQKEYRTAKEAKKYSKSAEKFGDAGIYFSADEEDDVSITFDQRQRLLDNSERIERTGNRLNEGYSIAVETEAMGAQVLNDLHHQRETLQSARSRMRETNADLGRASRTLNTMLLRALREKAVLYAVGVCFVLAVCISLYLSFSPSSTPSSN